MLGWSLPSNSGRFEATWAVSGTSPSHVTCDFEFLVRSDNPDAAPETEGGHRLLLSFRGLVVGIDELWRLARELERWHQLPLADLRRTPLVVQAELGGRYDEYLRLQFSPKSNEASDTHPVALFEYAIAGVSGSFSYATDPSCVGSLLAGLYTTLENLAA